MPQPSAFLETLTPAARDALLGAGHAKRWARGELLARAGDQATSAIVVLEGLVKIHKSAAGGAEVVFGISGPGDLLGEISAVREAVRSADASALESVDGVAIPVPALRAFLADHPAVTLALMDLALQRLRIADTRRLEFATAESLPRVAGRLIELAERFGTARPDGAIQVGLPINQEELASWSASSRESTARALRTLREIGLIETSRRRLVVLSFERLRAHAAT